jgi:uncharacterized membrane protein HdeD (DUF308 family)
VRGAARRIALVLGVVLGITGLASALVGLLAGSSLARSISVGFYLVGCFLIVLGFFSGVRGPVRPRGKVEDERPLASSFGVGVFWSGVRTATTDERTDALATAWVFLLLGIALIVAGVLVDSRVGFT